MTIYDAWSRGDRWVVCRGFLCRVSLPVGYGFMPYPDKFWVVHLGHWTNKRCQFARLVGMGEPVQVVKPNTPEFRKLYRG